MTHRMSKPEIMMATARLWARAATCPRLHVGAVLATPDHRIITTGFNGAPRGTPHCEDVGCLIDIAGHCRRANHAERNAMLEAARQGKSIDGSVLYVTYQPCVECTREAIQAGIRRIEFENRYPHPPELQEGMQAMLAASQMQYVHVPHPRNHLPPPNFTTGVMPVMYEDPDTDTVSLVHPDTPEP